VQSLSCRRDTNLPPLLPQSHFWISGRIEILLLLWLLMLMVLVMACVAGSRLQQRLRRPS
jgi:hypothetical protein